MSDPAPTLPVVLTAARLAGSLGQPNLRVVDCRFDLDDPDHGAVAFAYSRIPGACYADLERQLSAAAVPGRTGRHPLPGVPEIEATLRALGIGPDTRVVAYDGFDGAFAARLWWLLRWAGHEAVSVLDGGWPAWVGGGFDVDLGAPELPPAGLFVARPRPELLVTADELVSRLGSTNLCLLDARSPERFRGEQEPRDPVAGCIPGARNAFWRDNLDLHGRFLSPARLRARFGTLLGEFPPQEAMFYCGSGVTAAHDALAMAHAGLPLPRLYAGSWSEWITDASRPLQHGVAAPGVTRGS